MNYLIALCATFTLISSCNPVVILVHGTFGAQAEWCSPGGSFFQELETQAERRGHYTVPFTWSGSLGDEAKLRAAQILARLIISYPPHEEVILVAFSHGGNVVNIASQLLFHALQRTTGKETLAADVSLIRCMRTTSLWEKVLDDIARSLRHHAATATCRHPASYRIDSVYLLATPIAPALYKPNMQVIHQLYNIYSHGDGIQHVFGLYAQTFPPTPRITNLALTLCDQSGVLSAPGHTQMHDRCVARWLLTLPEIKDFVSEVDGEIQLSLAAPPVYRLGSVDISNA